ncbi:MAG: hypothetical protein NTZ98_02420 [Acidobacteria bacterium]|nr:hypothetical protein [Acidobacteriota bacterium]
MGDKRWYNYFVSVDASEEAGDAGQAAGSAAAQVERLARGTAPKPPATGPARPSTPSSGPPRSVSQIAAQVPPPKMTATAGAPVSFEEIYKLADISQPAHGYTILKVAEMLQSEHLRGLAPDVKRSSILVALEAAGVKLDAIIQDAVGRDRALDAYERAQQKALGELEARKAAENRQIQAELDRLIAEHQARIQANNDQVAREKDQLYGWSLKKQEEEQKIADAVGHFLSENPITTSAPRPAAPGSKQS